MSADGYKTQHGVKVETTERTVVTANSQITLGQTRLRRQRKRHRQQSYGNRYPGSARVEPDYPAGRQRQLTCESQKRPTKRWQRPQRVCVVASVSHVRNQSALKIAIAQARNLFQKLEPQSRLELSACTQ